MTFELDIREDGFSSKVAVNSGKKKTKGNDMKDKAKIASVRPSPLASIVGIVFLFAMLLFFLFFIASGPDTQGMGGGVIGVFLVIFVVVIIGGIIYHFVNLSTYSKSSKEKIPITADEVISIDPVYDESEEKPGSMEFDVKLRKLEKLRNDKLITEEEYKCKREEIMKEKW